MGIYGWMQFIILMVMLTISSLFFAKYILCVMEGSRSKIYSRIDLIILKIAGLSKVEAQSPIQYFWSVLAFGVIGIVILFLIQIFQDILPLNPRDFKAVDADLALNTAISFVTNTNWQSYSGEQSLSYLTQSLGLTWQNFISPAVGLGVAFALMRAVSREASNNAEIVVGNLWVDVMRAIIFIFLPFSFIFALFFISEGVVQSFGDYVEALNIEGANQTIAIGPVASQLAIKMLGTNGGGFFGVNSAHPFENPTALSNFMQIFLMLLIPASIPHIYGNMINDKKHGWAIYIAMSILFTASFILIYYAESQNSMIAKHIGYGGYLANLEGKDLRFGMGGNALFSAATTVTATGAVNSMHDSMTPLSALAMLLNMQLGEVIFGGIGAGFYGIFIFILITIFIAGLMVGRTPEYLGKKIENKEIQYAIIYMLISPFLALIGSMIFLLLPAEINAIQEPGIHGLVEILYNFTSVANNNGSAFAGVSTDNMAYNLVFSAIIFISRYGCIYLVLMIAASMIAKKSVAENAGSFPTYGGLFIGLLIGVIIIMGALTFFPVLMLGPILEHLTY